MNCKNCGHEIVKDGQNCFHDENGVINLFCFFYDGRACGCINPEPDQAKNEAKK